LFSTRRRAPAGEREYLSQTITTTPGAGYWLSLWLNNYHGSTPNEFLVSWNGSVLSDGSNRSAFGWTNLLFNVTASGTTASLQLGFDNDGEFGLDNDTSVYLRSHLISKSKPEQSNRPPEAELTGN
jgi:hypothetical protein